MIRMRVIANGMHDAKPTSPVFVTANDRIQKLLLAELDIHQEQADDLSALSGWPVSGETMLTQPKRR